MNQSLMNQSLMNQSLMNQSLMNQSLMNQSLISQSLSVQRTAFPTKRVNHHDHNRPITIANDRYVTHLPAPMIPETIYGKDKIKSLGMLESKE